MNNIPPPPIYWQDIPKSARIVENEHCFIAFVKEVDGEQARGVYWTGSTQPAAFDYLRGRIRKQK